MKTVDFLEEVKSRYGISSDYALAQFLRISKQAMSHYRHGGTMGEDVALVVADRLDLDPAYVLACIQAERSTDAHISAIWAALAEKAKRVGRKGGATVAAGILSVAFSGGPDAYNPDEHGAKSPSVIARIGSTLYTSWKVSAAKIACYMRAIFDELPAPEHA